MLYIWIASFIHACLVDRNLQICADPERGTGVRTDPPPPPPPLKNHKKGFLAILVSITWKITKLQRQHSMLTQQNSFNGVSLVGRWWSAFSGIGFFLLFSRHEQKQQQKSCQTCSWTLSDKAVWIRAWQTLVYKYRQLFPTEEVHYFLNHRRKYFFTFLTFYSFIVNVKIIFRI